MTDFYKQIETSFDREVGRAIEEENRRVIDALCGRCSGTGRIYKPPTDGSTSWTKHTCVVCRGTGLR